MNGTTYFYVVTASGANGASGNSPEASATPFANSSGIWISTTDGNWGGTTNWSGGQVATGPGSIADFSTLSLDTNVTVTLDTARTVSVLKFGDTSGVYNWSLAGTNLLTLGAGATFNVVNDAVTINTPVAGTNGLAKNGAGTVTLAASNSLTGGVAVNAGSFALTFAATNAPAANLIPTNALSFAGSALQVTGNTNGASTQNFSATTLNIGATTVAATNFATVNLGGITPNIGGVIQFNGPATTGAGGGNVASNANLTTTVVGTGAFVGGSGTPYFSANFATVGLYDFAATVGAASPYSVIGGSQVAGFYTAGSGSAPSAANIDVTGNITGWASQPFLTTMRFNTNLGATINVANSGSFPTLSLGDILVTPNVGAYNVVFNSSNLRPAGGSTSSTGPLVFWQNNLAGELIINSQLANSKVGAASYVQAGPGTVYLANTGSGYTNVSYLNGGFTLIAGNGSIGSATFGRAVNLNGGALVANATFALDNAGTAIRPINLLANGGALAATAGNTLLVGGVVGSAADTGPLTIGIAASAANNFTPGLLPGTGAGTANPTPVLATGTVVLTNANYHTGGTVLQSGTLNINGIFALGGANYGGLTFNGGTLQYVTNFPGSNGSADLTSIGTAGVTLAAGGGTIDLNGNVVTYAGAIGNGGSGDLLVKSSLPGGMLNLSGANNYLGDTTVTNATLSANNASGSATGAGNVFVQNAATLIGDGLVNGSVTIATGGTLAPGGFNSFNIGNDLTLAPGSTTRLQLQRAPLSNTVVSVVDTINYGGALVVTNLGGTLAVGDTFQLFNAANFAGGFTSLTLPALPANLFWNTNLLAVNGRLSVATNTPPQIIGLTLGGGEFILNVTGGLGGATCYVLATTNLATPLPNWQRLFTNQFEADGSLNLTNALNSGQPQTYYRIQLP